MNEIVVFVNNGGKLNSDEGISLIRKSSIGILDDAMSDHEIAKQLIALTNREVPNKEFNHKIMGAFYRVHKSISAFEKCKS